MKDSAVCPVCNQTLRVPERAGLPLHLNPSSAQISYQLDEVGHLVASSAVCSGSGVLV